MRLTARAIGIRFGALEASDGKFTPLSTPLSHAQFSIRTIGDLYAGGKGECENLSK